MAKIPTSIEDFKAPLKGLNPDVICEEIKANVSAFIEKEIKAKSNETLLLLGRKSSLLFQTVYQRASEKGYSVAILRRLNDANWTKGVVTENVSLLADCINTGDEVRYAVKDTLKKGRKINGIYCYACNSETLEKLKADQTFKDIPINVAFVLESNNSQDFFRKVQVYYQSLLHPIDSDHAYDIYQPGSTLGPKVIQKIVQLACREILGAPELYFDDDPTLFLPKNMSSMSLDISSFDSNKSTLSSKMKDFMDLLDFDYPFIKLKTQAEKGRTRFSIMSCFPLASLDITTLKNKKDCIVVGKAQCFSEIVTCNLSRETKDTVLCPLCVANYVERSLLNQISSYVISHIPPWKGIFGIIPQKYDPIERQI
ncbi:MAG: hypothetical protein ACLQO7_03425 [Candidatus Bathyarchaeia archaeon]